MAVISNAQENLLGAITGAQSAAISAVSTVTETVAGFLPSLPEIPFAKAVPAPAQVIENGFSFVERLVASQKSYALELAKAVSPLTSKVGVNGTAKTTKTTKA